MDNIFNVIKKETRKFQQVKVKHQSNWCSVTMDKYSTIEYHVQQHERALMREWQHRNRDDILDHVNVADISKSIICVYASNLFETGFHTLRKLTGECT